MATRSSGQEQDRTQEGGTESQNRLQQGHLRSVCQSDIFQHTMHEIDMINDDDTLKNAQPPLTRAGRGAAQDARAPARRAASSCCRIATPM